MKITEGKHNHNLTTILKSCLFGLIMILPFLAILPSTLYFAFNEHAQNYTHEEVIEKYEYETNEVNSVDDLIEGNIYKFTFDFNTFSSSTTFLDVYGIHLLQNEQGYTSYKFNSAKPLVYYPQNNTISLLIYVDNATQMQVNNLELQQSFYVVYSNIRNQLVTYENFSASDYLGEKNVEVVSSEQSPLNAFNTASNNVWNSPIFNWVNDGLGTIAIANMLTVFGIAQNTFISNILIYWLSITTIYIIIDIVITAFTILTHLLMKKAE